MYVSPTMCYGTECWQKKHVQKVRIAEMRILRWMSENILQDKLENELIHERVGIAPILDKMRNHLRWFGHVRRRPWMQT